MTLLIIYSVFLIALGFYEFRKTKSVESFMVANRSANAFTVSTSIVASSVGASATIGLIGLSYKVGFPAIWWFLSAAFGLILLGSFLAAKVRQSGALSMPEILEIYIGKRVRFLASVIIIIAWSAILAAQYSASARIISSISGLDFNTAIILSAFIIILYSTLGGQSSVLKSDIYQYALVLLSFLAIFIWLIFVKDASFSPIKFELFNDEFKFDKWTYYMIIQGGSYVVCPMLFGRILSSKSVNSAKKGVVFAVFGIVFSALLIILVGMLGAGLISTEIEADKLLTQGIYSMLPPWLGILLLFGLLSAIISSADSCLITASGVFCHDILRAKSLLSFRVFSIIFGLLGLILTFSHKSILGYLFAANDIYVSGVVAPIFIALVFKNANEKIILLAMALGGSFGLYAALSDDKNFSLIGVLVSIILAILAVIVKQKKSNF